MQKAEPLEVTSFFTQTCPTPPLPLALSPWQLSANNADMMPINTTFMFSCLWINNYTYYLSCCLCLVPITAFIPWGLNFTHCSFVICGSFQVTPEHGEIYLWEILWSLIPRYINHTGNWVHLVQTLQHAFPRQNQLPTGKHRFSLPALVYNFLHMHVCIEIVFT